MKPILATCCVKPRDQRCTGSKLRPTDNRYQRGFANLSQVPRLTWKSHASGSGNLTMQTCTEFLPIVLLSVQSERASSSSSNIESPSYPWIGNIISSIQPDKTLIKQIKHWVVDQNLTWLVNPALLEKEDSLVCNKVDNIYKYLLNCTPMSEMDQCESILRKFHFYHLKGCEANTAATPFIVDICAQVTLWHCDIVILWHCDIVTLWHCDIVTLWHCDIVTLWHCDIVILWHCDIVQWQSAYVTLLKSMHRWHSDILTFWYCDIVILCSDNVHMWQH